MIRFSEFVFLIENRIEYLKKTSGLHPDDVDKIAQADPTESKVYTQWLIKRHKKGEFPLLGNEFINAKNRETLDHFDKIKTHHKHFLGGKTDINQYKSIEDLNNSIHPFVGNKILDEDGIKVYSAKTPEQAEYHGRDSKWCTASRNSGHVASYLKAGGLKILHTGDPEEKYQWFEGGKGKVPELKDINNNEVEPHELEQRHPAVKNVHGWDDFKEAHYSHHSPEEEDEHDIHQQIYDLVHSHNESDRVEAVETHSAHHDFPHLYDDASAEVKKAIIDKESERSYNHRDRVHRKFIDDDDDEVKGHVAEHAVHPGIIKDLIDNYHDVNEVREGLSTNPKTPKEFLHKLVDEDESSHIRSNTLMSVLNRDDMEHGEKFHLANKVLDKHKPTGSYHTAQHLAGISSNLDDDRKHKLLDKMSVHPDEQMRKYAADSEPERYVHKLKDDSSEIVRSSLAYTYPHLFTDVHQPERTKAIAARFGDTNVIDKMIHHDSNNIKKQILDNPNCENRHITHMIKDLSQRPKSDSGWLAQQIAHKGIMFDEDNHRAAANSRHIELHMAAATFSHDPEVLEAMSKHHLPQIRGRVAQNQHTPDHVLDKLSNDENNNVMFHAKNTKYYKKKN